MKSCFGGAALYRYSGVPGAIKSGGARYKGSVFGINGQHPKPKGWFGGGEKEWVEEMHEQVGGGPSQAYLSSDLLAYTTINRALNYALTLAHSLSHYIRPV